MEYVTADGELQNPVFSRCSGAAIRESPSPSNSSENGALEEILHAVREILLRLNRMESDAATRKLQIEEQHRHQQLVAIMGEVRSSAQELLKRVPRSEERNDHFSYDYASREYLEGLRRLCGGNINQFALDLEKEIYKGDTSELALAVDKRVSTATQVDFLKESIFKYYLVPVETRESVWRGVKGALNSRVRRLRSSAGSSNTTPSRVQLQADRPRMDIYCFSDDE